MAIIGMGGKIGIIGIREAAVVAALPTIRLVR
ncbi:hypothetical protein EUBDOL_00090 [Amedibacillus dolichus DSM 3991]|uniref:Uncharacterized protein n=1 Tax=Amedibacillus dolichus DSM 3991 TaxID=428127 RepID=A8R7V8_9FIRM|nr:hypothetical protein EUBDOL_00090 [Amedibacillus dolichus DSM 3991]